MSAPTIQKPTLASQRTATAIQNIPMSSPRPTPGFQNESVTVMTQPVTLYSAGMVGNPANSGDSGISTRPGSLVNRPDTAGDGVYEETDPHITAIVLTGGRSTRFGADKASTRVAGATLLDHVLADIHPSIPVIIVGPAPQLAGNSKTSETSHNAEQPARSLIVTREDPPGGGPVAGVLAGLELVTTSVCCVIATDMPTSASIALGLAAEHVRQFRSSSTSVARVQAENSQAHIGTVRSSGAAHRQPSADAVARTPAESVPAWDVDDAAVPLDASGHTQHACSGPPESTVPEALIPIDAAGHAQPLCASYSTAALRRVAATLGSGNGAPFRDLLGLLRVHEVQLDVRDRPKLFDIDTRDDLSRTRQAIMAHVGGRFSLPETGGTNMLNDWAVAAASELGLDTEVDVEVILDVAKEAAHGVARPAAPLTTYLLGYAVAKGADLQEVAAKMIALAENWPQNQE